MRKALTSILALALGWVALGTALRAQIEVQSARELTGYLPARTPLVVDLFDGPACAARGRLSRAVRHR